MISAVPGKLFVLAFHPHLDHRAEDIIFVVVIAGDNNITIRAA